MAAKQSDWISIDTALPDINVPVLTLSGFDVSVVTIVAVLNADGTWTPRWKPVTHWQLVKK